MRKARKSERNKHKKRFRVILEIAFMVLGIVCGIMPYPFPLLVPIGIGTVRIISSAIQKEKAAEAPPPVVYCNGTREHKATREKRITKKQTDSTPPKKSAEVIKPKGK